MMGAYSPRWRRFLQKHLPFLFRLCPAHNFHWRTDKVCCCMAGCNGFHILYRFGNGWYDLGAATCQVPVTESPYDGPGFRPSDPYMTEVWELRDSLHKFCFKPKDQPKAAAIEERMETKYGAIANIGKDGQVRPEAAVWK